MDEITRATGALDVTAVADRDWPADLDDTTLTEGPLFALLAGRVPISLIMDLAMPAGPHSRELLEAEGSPEVAWWEPR